MEANQSTVPARETGVLDTQQINFRRGHRSPVSVPFSVKFWLFSDEKPGILELEPRFLLDGS